MPPVMTMTISPTRLATRIGRTNEGRTAGRRTGVTLSGELLGHEPDHVARLAQPTDLDVPAPLVEGERPGFGGSTFTSSVIRPNRRATSSISS